MQSKPPISHCNLMKHGLLKDYIRHLDSILSVLGPHRLCLSKHSSNLIIIIIILFLKSSKTKDGAFKTITNQLRRKIINMLPNVYVLIPRVSFMVYTIRKIGINS